MKFLHAKCFILVLCLLCPAQSGRIKQTPEDIAAQSRPRSVKEDTKKSPTPTPIPVPTPKPTPVLSGDDDVISIDSTLVPIPASVTDESGQPVIDLQLKDFELLVDDQKAEISDLSHSDTPVRLALLFDNSSSLTSARDFELKAATRFLRRVLRPDRDMAALYSVSTYTKLEQPLTKNVGSLVNAIETLPPPSGATALLDAIIEAANYLRESDGRRVIVIVSDGEDTISDLETTLEKVVQRVQSRNCQVYVVKTTDFENYKKTGSRGGNANLMNLTAESRMQELTRQTGGAVYSPLDEKEMDLAFARISAELSQQYILSYYPENKMLQGDFHQISLKVKNRPGLTVRTRKGYYVPRKK
jgi:Ca-activated chloride channel family protein